jgi:cytochrome c5
MNKYLLATVTLSITLCSVAQAASYKGQKEYMKKCRGCHGGGQAVAASRTINEWNDLLSAQGRGLANLHVNSKKAKESVAYFTGSRYAKKWKHLKDFMVEYAQDSGNVPACH